MPYPFKSSTQYKGYLDIQKEKCPYRMGQLIFAKFINDDWILARVVAIAYCDEKIKIRGVYEQTASSIRKYNDRIRTLTSEQEMLVILENA